MLYKVSLPAGAVGPDSPAQDQEESVTRDQALIEARQAAARAKELAQAADRDLDHPTLKHDVPRLAAASTAYADVASAYAAIAAATPTTEA